MNILINSKCNKSCENCFESSNFKNITEDMSLNMFKSICDWICHSYGRNSYIPIQIFGGEPTLHPELDEMLTYLIELKLQGYNIQFCLITNGFNLEKYLHKISLLQGNILLNVSAMDDTDDEIIKTIKKFVEYKIFLTASLIVSDESVLPLLKKLVYNFEKNEIHGYRPSSAVIKNAKDGFYEINKIYILEAYEFLNKNERLIATDCFKIPLCYYTEEERKRLFSFNIYRNSDNYLSAVCNPYSTDILPNGSFVSCMPLFDINKKDLFFYEFNNCEEVYLYMNDFLHKESENKFDRIKDNYCKECIEYKTKRCCGGCLGMNILPKLPNTQEIYKKKYKPSE